MYQGMYRLKYSEENRDKNIVSKNILRYVGNNRVHKCHVAPVDLLFDRIGLDYLLGTM